MRVLFRISLGFGLVMKPHNGDQNSRPTRVKRIYLFDAIDEWRTQRDVFLACLGQGGFLSPPCLGQVRDQWQRGKLQRQRADEKFAFHLLELHEQFCRNLECANSCYGMHGGIVMPRLTPIKQPQLTKSTTSRNPDPDDV